MAEQPAPPNDAVQADDYLAVAQVVGAHGIRGDLRCALLTDFPERFKRGLKVYLGAKRTLYEVQRGRAERNRLTLKLVGIDTRDDAEALRGVTVFVAESDAVRLPRGTFFWHQIIGLRVRTADGRALGNVVDILQTGANDVYVVRAGPEQRELLLPAIKDVVKQIDLASGEMTVELIEGLG
jgi:16S rRNA processing protein RimM